MNKNENAPKRSKVRKPRKPSKLTPEVREEILQRLAYGEPLRRICRSLESVEREEDRPHASAVVMLISRGSSSDAPTADKEFSERYARAREIGYQMMADEIIDIVDDLTEDANSRRVRADGRKWLLSKALPKIYGDKNQAEVPGKIKIILPDYVRRI